MTNTPNMSCPVCSVPLVMSERQGVEIDYCPQCRGVWLDRGELDKVIERSVREFAPAPTPQPTSQAHQPSRQEHQGDYGRQHGGYPQKRRKSFLEELFD